MGDEDSGWVLDSLINFLSVPVWNVPIYTFIEHKSLTFEQGLEDTESHTEIFEEYKKLVDFMLGSFMEDMNISPEQCEAACTTASINTPFHQRLFEPVWAADDYEVFKRMMIQKNLELQLQALEILQFRHGITPESCQPMDGLPQGEQDILEEVLKKSLEEHETLQSSMNSESKDLERAIAESQEEHERLDTERRREKELLERALKASTGEEQEDEQTAAPVQSTIDPDELLRRQEYLKAQRDKLLAMKQQEREKQLRQFEGEQGKTRPKSAKAARRVIQGGQLDAKTLQVRRALAERLKAEVINTN